MIISIITNGKERKHNIPTSWDQVTFKQFLALESCGQDIIKVISLFTGVKYETLLKSKVINLDGVIAKLAFLKVQPNQIPPPKTILGYPVPEKLEFEQVQMYVDLKNYIQETHELTPTEKLAKYTIYCAVYACSHKHGHYDWKKAEAMADEFLAAPCTEVMAIGNFTLLKLIGLNYSINPNSQKASSLITRCKQALKIYMINTVSALRWYLWKRKQA